MNSRKREPTELTERESQVMALVAEGYRSKEIAQILCVEITTINRHRWHANRKWRELEERNRE